MRTKQTVKHNNRERDSLSEFMRRPCQSCIVVNNSVSPLIPEHTSGGSAKHLCMSFLSFETSIRKVSH